MTNRLDVAWTLTAYVALMNIGLPCESRGDEPISLIYKFQANQSLHYQYSQQMTMDVKKRGFQQHLEAETIAHKHLRIISVDADGQALVEPVVDTARMKSVEDDRVSEFDSAEGRKNCPTQYRRLFDSLGKPLVRIKFAPNGKVLEATGVNGGEKAAQGLQDDATLNFLVVFPDRPLQVGDIWNDDFEVFAQVEKSLRQAIKVRREYRLAKLDDSAATIEMKLGTITPMNNPAIELQIASRLVSGTIVFDHVAGKIVRRDLSVDRQVINALGSGSLVRTTMTQSETASSPLPPVAGREEAARD